MKEERNNALPSSKDSGVKRRRYSSTFRSKLLQEQEGKCFYCKKGLSYIHAIVEHKIPICRGGKQAKDNLCVSCSTCDKLKGGQTDKEFMNPKTRRR